MNKLLALLAVSTAVTPAAAQDVVVMRRQIAAPIITGKWDEGAWRWTGADACTASAPRERDVACKEDGRVVGDLHCAGTKPVSKGTAERRDGCTYAWHPGDYGEWSAQCSKTATHDRTVQCLRQDGAPASSDALCTQPKLDTTETAWLVARCGWDEGAWGTPSGCGAVQESRSINCLDLSKASRTDVESCRRAAEQALIDPEPAATRPGTDYSTCSYKWDVDQALTPWSSTCSTQATRQVTWKCLRSDGTAITDADQIQQRCGTRPSSTQTGVQASTCTTLQNGDFESTGGWVETSRAKYAANAGPDGSRAMAIDGASGDCRNMAIKQTVRTKAYAPLTLTFQTRTNNYYDRKQFVYVDTKAGNDSASRRYGYQMPNGKADWKTNSVDVTPSPYGMGAGQAVDLTIIIYTATAGSYESSSLQCEANTMWVDNVAIGPR